eukprot:3749968-Pleurochrysis_carterae.AAC.1
MILHTLHESSRTGGVRHARPTADLGVCAAVRRAGVRGAALRSALAYEYLGRCGAANRDDILNAASAHNKLWSYKIQDVID